MTPGEKTVPLSNLDCTWSRTILNDMVKTFARLV